MAVRRPLQLQLSSAWKRVVSEHYVTRQINSERSLQASFWSQLVNELPNNRRTFIEPRIRSTSDQTTPQMYPDLVVCNSRAVIAVVEIKYNPRTLPRYKKDLTNLSWLADNQDSVYVENNRYLGDKPKKERYAFGSNVLFVWASIHRQHSRRLDAVSLVSEYPALSDAFVELFAETTDDVEPEVGMTST